MKHLLLFILIFSFRKFAFSVENPPADSSLKPISIGSNSSQILFEHPKGSFTFYWGYNRDYFSKSDIHFSGPDYNFTLHNVVAKDRQSPFSYYNYVKQKWVPQYNYRVGYFLTDKICLSLGLDHMKYVVKQNQSVTISGNIYSKASEKYRGSYNNDTVLLTPDFLRFEHTNGFNLVSFDAAFSQSLFWLAKRKINVSINGGLGIGALIPKSEVYVFDNGMDNRFHLAGYSVTAKFGPRINFLNWFFLSGELRGGYANLPSVLIKGDLPLKASHSLWFLEYYVVGGVYFRFSKK